MTTASSSSLWCVVLGPDGVVHAVTGGAPDAWVGTRLSEVSDASAAVRAAAVALVRRVCDPRRGTAVERVVVASERAGAPEVELLALEAVPVRRRPVALRALLAAALEPLRKQAEAQEIALQFEDLLPPELPPLRVDPEKLAWAVTTLVGTALRHVRRGTRTRPGGAITVAAAFDAEPGDLLLEVSDDGPGIEPERLRWLFERAPGAPVSVGFALPLVREVVLAHGGSLEVESATEPPEQGTTVTLRVPYR